MLLLAATLLPGCVTSQFEEDFLLHVEGRLVSCVDELPLEGVNVLMNVATEQQEGPRQYLHTLSDGSGIVDAEVKLQYRGGSRWRRPALLLSTAVDFEFVFDLEGYAPQYVRIPGTGVKPAEGIHTLRLGQICLEPSAADSLFLYTKGQPPPHERRSLLPLAPLPPPECGDANRGIVGEQQEEAANGRHVLL
jgi:hypothetical protein